MTTTELDLEAGQLLPARETLRRFAGIEINTIVNVQVAVAVAVGKNGTAVALNLGFIHG